MGTDLLAVAVVLAALAVAAVVFFTVAEISQAWDIAQHGWHPNPDERRHR